MRSLPHSLLALTAAVMSACTAVDAAENEGRPPIEQLERRLAMGPLGDPVAAADAAIRAGDFRLYWGQGMVWGSPIGITCHGPTYLETSGPTADGLVKGVVTYSDVIGSEETRFEASATDYAKAYNRRIIVGTGYPFPDVCRPARPDDRGGGPYPARWSTPAGRAGPARTLADAARIGSQAEMARFLATPGVRIDEVDAFGMTPLAWAVVRGNDVIARRLLAAGAAPLGEGRRHGGQAPMLYAVAFKRPALFRAMYAFIRREDLEDLRTDLYVQAAVLADDTLALSRFLPPGPIPATEARKRIRSALYRQNYAVVEYLLARAGPALDADALLEAAVATGDLKFVDRALKAGADPGGGAMVESPPLYELAGSPTFATAPQIAQRLIRAGARVDPPDAADETPLQVLARRGAYPPVYPEWAEPRLPAISPAGKTELLKTLIAGGGNVNRMSDGTPMVMQLLHVSARQPRPQNYDPEWLRLMSLAGMDVNARLEGRTALDYAQAAGDPALVALLRDLGAR